MVKKIKYALTMADGAKVRTLEDLRDHFDWPHVLGYFLDGKLAEWLRDRYFDELAASVESLPAESPNLEQQLCHLLGVAWEAKETTVDVTRMQRRQEKEALLRQMTADESIWQHGETTAFTQGDLDELIGDGVPVIYLCGEEFTVPADVVQRTYIGILGRPRIQIDAVSPDELEEKGIVFEQADLPEQLRIPEEPPEPVRQNNKQDKPYVVSGAFQSQLNDEQQQKAAVLYEEAQHILGAAVFDIDVSTRQLLDTAREELGRANFDIDVSTHSLLDAAREELGRATFDIDVSTRPLVSAAREELGHANFDIDVSTHRLLDTAREELGRATFDIDVSTRPLILAARSCRKEGAFQRFLDRL